ncbi:MAG: hypothetical protein ACI9R3_001842, partial [Verrucomicrobiales bacterium]
HGDYRFYKLINSNYSAAANTRPNNVAHLSVNSTSSYFNDIDLSLNGYEKLAQVILLFVKARLKTTPSK